jgi:hypothetical protein
MNHHTTLRAAGAHLDRYTSDSLCEQWYCDSDATLCAIGDNRETLCPDFALSLHGECAEKGKHRFAVYLDRPIQSEAERLRASLRTIRAMASDMATGTLSEAVMREWAGRIVSGCDAMLGEA